MSWHPFDNGKSIGLRGSESGTIIRDEEHSDGARITLERGCQTAPFAITCGIYGWMVHTHFLGAESDGQTAFDQMKTELARIVTTIPLTTDPDIDAKSRMVSHSLSEFVERFR